MSEADTIPRMFARQARARGEATLFLVKRDGQWRPISWRDAHETVRALAAFLFDRGIAPGDRVLILCENRPEWGLADLAIQHAGAWTVPIYPSLTPPEIQTILRDCEPSICIVSTHEQADKLRGITSAVPSIRLLVIIQDGLAHGAQEVSWEQAIRQGREALARQQTALDERLARINPTDAATIIYTSGTTGEPKGVQLSHRNFLSNVAACLRAVSITPDDTHLSFLPMCHSFERMAGWYLMLTAGASVAYAESMDTIPQDMLEVRPTVMLGVPRFFEKLYARVQAGLAAPPAPRQRLAHWAFAVGRRVGALRLSRASIPLGLRLQHRLADRLVLHKLRQRLGGRLRFFISGSAPLSKTIGEFFYDAGVLILEGYGLSETSPVITVNRPDAVKFGTVGQPIDGVEVRIADDGEILTRGPHVMLGYYRKLEATQAVIVDGWFHTGDIGAIDADGFLAITDRKKDLIKTAGGKYVAPQKLENRFVTDPYISQAFVYGDKERYCVALIVPNFAKLADYAKSHAIACASPQELARSSAIQQFVWSRVEALQRDLAGYEQVKYIALLDQEFSQAAGELTPTLKAKRAAIAARYQPIIRSLYGASAA